MKVFVIEDNPVYNDYVCNLLKKDSFDTMSAYNLATAKKLLAKSEVDDIVVADLRLPDGESIELLRWMRANDKQQVFIVMTNYGEVHTAVESMKLGSKDYIQKQLLEDKLIPLIRTLQKEHEKRLQWNIPIFVRQGEAYQKIKKRVRLVATTRMSVLILGENGTGKEHIAQHIHQQSKLADKPFVAVDCGALSPSLIQSAFFGHVKGAFTGAEANKTGYFLEADGGTLFLDEVGNLTMEMQQMLLRAIQERRYRPVGAKEDKTANVRIVAATNEDLQKAVTEKRFRQDLLYRLQEYVITMPPLRDCPEDIMPLAEFFREMANRELEREVKGFAASARNALLAHAWPGNVRELKQKIQTAVLQSEGDMITEADLELDNEPSATSACFTLKSGDEERGRILCTAPQKLDTFGVFFMKYNYEIRLKAVKLVLEGGLSVREAGCHLGCGRSQVHLWVTLFERHGLTGLKLRHGSYSAEFKLSVLKHMHQNHLSLLETAVHFGIPGPFVIRQWGRLYQNQGAEGLRRKPQRRRPAMSKSKTKKVKLKTTPHEELLKELEYLRAENAYLKKLQALVEERIVRESGKEPKPSKD